jgi:hypothetical protein
MMEQWKSCTNKSRGIQKPVIVEAAASSGSAQGIAVSCSRCIRGRLSRRLLRLAAPTQAIAASCCSRFRPWPHRVAAESISCTRQWPHQVAAPASAAWGSGRIMSQHRHQLLQASQCSRIRQWLLEAVGCLGRAPSGPLAASGRRFSCIETHPAAAASNSGPHHPPVPYIRQQAGLGMHHLKQIRLMP